jgi:hypothetical protein
MTHQTEVYTPTTTQTAISNPSFINGNKKGSKPKRSDGRSKKIRHNANVNPKVFYKVLERAHISQKLITDTRERIA